MRRFSILFAFLLLLAALPVAHATYFRSMYDSNFQHQACVGSPCQLDSWTLYTYPCTGGSATVSWDSAHGDIVGSASANGCGLSGWKASYQPVDTTINPPRTRIGWGVAPVGNDYQYGVDLNPPTYALGTWPYISLQAQVMMTTDNSNCNALHNEICVNIFIDYWIFWTSPVGPNNLQYMELFVALEDSRCNGILGCPADYFATGSFQGLGDYQYFHFVQADTLNQQVYFNVQQSDMANLFSTAFGHWSLPHAGAWITGIDFAQETGGGNYNGAATLYLNQMYACPADSPTQNQGYYGTTISC